jgi:dihydrofolate reductase
LSFQVIVAVDRAGGIGRDGGMPWHLPADLKYFARMTKAVAEGNDAAVENTVIMGRRTWDSIPDRFRPLAQRRNIVVSRQAGFHADGAESALSLDHALAMADPRSSCFVIGGAMIYQLALAHPDCAGLLVTEIDADFECTVRFPSLDAFERVMRGEVQHDNDLEFRFCRWQRR